MNLKEISCAITFSLAAALPMTSFAHTVSNEKHVFGHHFDDVLSSKSKLNKNLDEGDYDFLGLHSKSGSTFNDAWQFTLADTSNVIITLSDLAYSLGDGFKSLSSFGYGDSHHGKKSSQHSSTNPLLDNKFLTFSLFDDEDHLLGTAGEGGSISALGLAAGEWYTITVSAKVNGFFGSAYRGNLDITPSANPTAVPLGDSLPMFASALLLMTIRTQKRKSVQA